MDPQQLAVRLEEQIFSNQDNDQPGLARAVLLVALDHLGYEALDYRITGISGHLIKFRDRRDSSLVYVLFGDSPVKHGSIQLFGRSIKEWLWTQVVADHSIWWLARVEAPSPL
jgi:hypothetical protein